MLRSESNSSITTTQPTIGWQPVSDSPLLLFLFPTFTFLALIIYFKITCSIHRVWLNSYPTGLVLPNFSSGNFTRLRCVAHLGVEEVIEHMLTRGSLGSRGVFSVCTCVCMSAASLITSRILGSGVCYCMLVKTEFFKA